ncbi:MULTISPECIES: hypothetical protein [unclassified Rothia (in: high G+C Gram-positive bacteria)]|uniref:hypothetical protein n=1 Tax=unclassified Rothia (in: high G+C Gram-positive bacteria) TaxID=2689056 RepID=UPI00195BCBCD|nr:MULTISPECIES: hypothetical protein [unclassified Rothia (in: high G+C Gram-positive bacteria)]MBM7051120.1 hypothetical protein [Rothia sp. ZJ1223]QRZ62180.1 hypothetical protein JR346_03440 [Rothia sp. ZJ932]
MSRPTHNPGTSQPLYLEDTPEALSEGGFHDEFEAEQETRSPAVAVHNASFTTALHRFYAQYWLRTGTSSTSELLWALVWLVAVTAILFGATGYTRALVDAGTASSLTRTLYMLVFMVDCLWVMANLGPLGSVIARYRNYRAAR